MTEDAGERDAVAMALLWGERPGGRRGPRPGLTLERIAAAGVAIADAEGLAAVTMQGVARRLGVTKMALYRYVPGRRELIALMVEAAMGEPPHPAGGWRQRLDAWARTAHRRFADHPWAAEATLGARPLGPNEVAWMEEVAAALAGTGLPGAEMLDTAATLASHVRMMAQLGNPSAPQPEESITGLLTQVLATHADRYPALTAALASAMSEQTSNQALDFGLARILDGLETRIGRLPERHA